MPRPEGLQRPRSPVAFMVGYAARHWLAHTIMLVSVVVAVACNSQKNALFSFDERVDMIQQVVGNQERVTVDTFTGLLIDYVAYKKAHVIIRGLRAISDFEYEFQIAQMNSCISQNVETLFMMTSLQYGYLSSSIVKEVCSLNGNIDGFVPPEVKKALRGKYGLD